MRLTKIIVWRTTMPVVTWDHVHLRSPDPEATAIWLQDILGGQIIRGPGRIDVKLGGANVFIAPVAAGGGVNTPPVTPYQGLDHFGLTVKDIDAVAAEIKAKGVEFTKEPTTIRPGVRICFIRGPQGISVELLERDKKYARGDAACPGRSTARSSSRSGALQSRGLNELRRLVRS